DVCTKLQLRRYGGRGFSYVSEYFLPELRRLGLSREQVRRIVVENPRRVLTFVSPRAELSR
ncbi:MAG: aryldialkylphosphatase, partial [Acidobacteria bacterium]